MGRKKQKLEAADRAAEIKQQAREVAGHSGEALKDFAEDTGAAAKEFAGKTREAAKELVESIEKAAKGVEKQPKRGRRFLKTTVALGVGVALLTNDRVRQAISSAMGRSRGGVDEPEVWRPDSSGAGDGVRAPAGEKTS